MEIIMKIFFIVIMGQIYPAIVVELKKLQNWITVSTCQNPFQLIQMLTVSNM